MSERADPKTCLKPAFAGFRQPKVNLNERKPQIIVKNQHQAEEISALSIALIGFKDSSQIFLTLVQICVTISSSSSGHLLVKTERDYAYDLVVNAPVVKDSGSIFGFNEHPTTISAFLHKEDAGRMRTLQCFS